jgi:UDP-N-acetylmuramoylalanine--D-glutamate ligase
MSKYKGKKVSIVGFGISGVSVAKYMAKQGAKVLVTDTKQKSELAESINACADLKIEYELGRHNPKVLATSELVVLSPGIPMNSKALEEAIAARVPLTNEIELAASAIKEPIIGVTGTNGKTTTTTLIGEMFKADGKNPYVGGNIGKPLLDYVSEGQKADVVVAELSSFQLELTQRLVPAVAVFTNLEADHLDRYPDLISCRHDLPLACARLRRHRARWRSRPPSPVPSPSATRAARTLRRSCSTPPRPRRHHSRGQVAPARPL